MNEISISIAQMDAVANDVDRNFRIGVQLIEEASRQGGEIVLLPEMWIAGLDMRNLPPLVDEIENNYLHKLTATAKKNNIIIIGSIPTRTDDRIYNTSMIISKEGKIIGKYNKIHLVNLVEFSEDIYIERGKNLSVVETEYGKIGTIICYDMRFPELARLLATNGANILFVPAAWPLARRDHWRLLLRARAVENQMYVIGCNMAGESNNIQFGAYSAIIDPWGEVMLELGSSINVVSTIKIDLNRINDVRNTITCFTDRDEALYKLVNE